MSTLVPIISKHFRLWLLVLLSLSWCTVPFFNNVTGLSTSDLAAWIPLKCPLLLLFDIHCPTCGLGRSLIAAWSIQFSEAWAHHFFGPIIYFGSYLFFSVLYFNPEFINRLFQNLRSVRPSVWLPLLGAYSVWGFLR